MASSRPLWPIAIGADSSAQMARNDSLSHAGASAGTLTPHVAQSTGRPISTSGSASARMGAPQETILALLDAIDSAAAALTAGNGETSPAAYLSGSSLHGSPGMNASRNDESPRSKAAALLGRMGVPVP